MFFVVYNVNNANLYFFQRLLQWMHYWHSGWVKLNKIVSTALMSSHFSQKKYDFNYIYTFCSCYIQGDLHCTEGTHFIRSWTDHTSFAFLPAWSIVWVTGTSCGVIKLFCVMILWPGCCQCKQGSFIFAVGCSVLFCFHYDVFIRNIMGVFMWHYVFLSKTQWLNWVCLS